MRLCEDSSSDSECGSGNACGAGDLWAHASRTIYELCLDGRRELIRKYLTLLCRALTFILISCDFQVSNAIRRYPTVDA